MSGGRRGWPRRGGAAGGADLFCRSSSSRSSASDDAHGTAVRDAEGGGAEKTAAARRGGGRGRARVVGAGAWREPARRAARLGGNRPESSRDGSGWTPRARRAGRWKTHGRLRRKSEKGAHLEGGEDGVLVVDAVEDFGPVLPVLHGVVVVRRALLGRDEPPRAVRHLREALPQPLGLMQRPRYRVGALAVRPLDPSRRFPGLRPDDARGAAVEPREPTRSTREAPRERGRAPRRDPATERAWGRPGRRRDRGGGARRGTPPSGKSRNDGGRAKRADRRGRHRAASLAALSKASVVSRGRVRR